MHIYTITPIPYLSKTTSVGHEDNGIEARHWPTATSRNRDAWGWEIYIFDAYYAHSMSWLVFQHISIFFQRIGLPQTLQMNRINENSAVSFKVFVSFSIAQLFPFSHQLHLEPKVCLAGDVSPLSDIAPKRRACRTQTRNCYRRVALRFPGSTIFI